MKKFFVLVVAFLGSLAFQGVLCGQTPTPTPDENPTGNTGALKPQIQTGGSYDAHSGNGTRIINDLAVAGALGVYGLDFTRYWNSTHNDYMDSEWEWPRDFGDSGWSHSWRWSAVYQYKEPEVVWTTCGESGQMCESNNNQFTIAINITFPDGHITQYKTVRLGHGEWQVPGDPFNFDPPYSDSEKANFADGGMGVHDHICNMATDGSEFWLCRADGGSVKFTLGGSGFLAREVYDPHGFKTTLSYNAANQLEWVEQERGGRFLHLEWGQVGGASVIISVQSGTGPDKTGVIQTVRYCYAAVPGTHGTALQHVYYDGEIDPVSGQTVKAEYHYGNCWGDEPASAQCTGPDASLEPLLKRADDPHFAGAMRTIRYNYRAQRCPEISELPGSPLAYPNHISAQPYAILAEKSDTGVTVSSFEITCEQGTRVETGGLGNYRTFYFGTAAQTASPPYACRGFQVGKLTDFWSPGQATVPFEQQNYLNGDPRHIWDGRGIMTEAIAAAGDDSGEPAEIHRADGSVDYYNRVNPAASGSDPIDPNQGMHNPYNHWVFSESHQINASTSFSTNYKRDARRRVTDIYYADGSSEHFVYNQSNQVTSHTLPSGAVITYIYNDTNGRLMSESNSVDGTGASIDYTYDLAGRVLTVSDGRARANNKNFSTRMTYNKRHQVVMVEYAGTDGSVPNDNPRVTYGYDAYGNCTSITNELGDTTLYTYDLYRRCTSFTEPLNAPDWNSSGTVPSRRWDWLYDRYIDGVGYKDRYAHTANEWRIQIEPAFNAAGERRMTARAHDVNNRIVNEEAGWIQPPGEIGPNNSWYPSYDDLAYTFFTYDENGQKSSYIDPQGRRTTYEYDIRNRLWKTNETVNTIQRTTETLYDFAGNKTRVNFPVEATGQRSQQWLSYDAFGQPRRFIDERSNVIDLTYWFWGPMKKLASVTTSRSKDGGGVETQPTTFDYDSMGRPQNIYFPDGSNEHSTYKFGQLESWKTRKDQTKYIHYDARGREDSHSWSDSSGVCNPATDTAQTPCVDRDWDSANRMTKIENRVSRIDYTYDAAAQVTSERDTVAGSAGTAQLTYHRYPDGAVAHIGYPNGLWVRHDYTPRGQLRIVDDYRTTLPTVSYQYFEDGKVKSSDYPDGTHTDYQYDGRGFTSSVATSYRNSGQELYRRNYYRDERDRITVIQRGNNPALNAMEDGHGDRFRYDEEGQLVEAWYDAPNPVSTGYGNARYELFNYDQLGNRQGAACLGRLGWQQFSRKDNKLNQYSMWSPFSPIKQDEDIGLPWGTPQHANGVTMQEGNVTAGYNALNQMVMVNTAGLGSNWMFFGYDPLGRRVQQWVGQLNPNPGDPPNYVPAIGNSAATFFYYDGWNLVQEGPNASSATRNYIHGARVDEIVKQIRPTDWWERYFHYDARGHCVFQTDAGGGIVEQYEYDAFGQPYFYDGAGNNVGSSTFGNRFLFTGREYLADLKLYDFRNRMYQPELGRFMSPDPKHFAAGDYNLYRYCHNDPVNKADPTGLKWHFVNKLGKAGRFDAQLKREFDAARAKFSAKDARLKAIFDAVDSDTTHTVTIVRSNLVGRNPEQFKGYESGNASFEWNPRAASSFVGGSQSPATVLLHEAAHAARFLSDKEGSRNDFNTGDGAMGRRGPFNNLEERRVILGPEAIAATALEENVRTTNSGNGTTYGISSLFGH